jgi:hypothetical protein
MADDREQRGFEVVKLRIAFLQHITTLSGAAILIILALVQRAPTPGIALQLAVTGSLFVYAALISVVGIASMLGLGDMAEVDYSRSSPGRRTTFFAGGAFCGGVAVALFAIAGFPAWTLLAMALGSALLSLVALAVLALLSRKPGRDDP